MLPNTSLLATKMKNHCNDSRQDKIISKVAAMTRDLAKTYAPHLTGNLRRSIYTRRISKGVYEVGSPLSYAWAVEFGSGVYSTGKRAVRKPIEPTDSAFLAFKIGGEWIRVRYVLGQRPQPFLRPAVEKARNEFARISGSVK
jgi:HK97 gp10 family phage protein